LHYGLGIDSDITKHIREMRMQDEMLTEIEVVETRPRFERRFNRVGGWWMTYVMQQGHRSKDPLVLLIE